MSKGIFITATGTDIGKTYVTGLILKLLREATEVEPKASDYCKLIYAGYIGATNADISYEDFLDLIEDVSLAEISQIGVALLIARKN